jgi:hypothetical protein
MHITWKSPNLKLQLDTMLDRKLYEPREFLSESSMSVLASLALPQCAFAFENPFLGMPRKIEGLGIPTRSPFVIVWNTHVHTVHEYHV